MEIIHASAQPGGILTLTFRGSVATEDDVSQLKKDIHVISKAIHDFHAAEGKAIRILIDISDFSAEYVNDGVEALVDLARDDKNIVERTAIFGGSKKVRIIGSTIVALSARDNIKFFEEQESALAWLGQ